MRIKIIVCVCVLLSVTANAQMPARGNFGASNQLNVGHFYGKVVDQNNKPLEAATVQLYGNRFDSSEKKMRQMVLATVLTAANGDFSLNDLPVMGKFKLRVTSIGYADFEKEVSFDIRRPAEGTGTDRMQQMIGMADKDLGNIKLTLIDATLGAVTVTATQRLFEMGIDRKVFNVDQNLVTTGQTATEVMKQIPSINVDIDGNVTMRNATPQLFVDGRPTTLTMEQIPADIIDKVELITNPSAKYDASGGNAGILNIVLKKNRRTGYNGGLRAGLDSKGRMNLGGDINARQDKVNFFLSGMLNQRKSNSWGNTTRSDIKPSTDQVIQYDTSNNSGFFGFVRGGMDYFIDIRNTLSFSASYSKGKFDVDGSQTIDSVNTDPTHQFRTNSGSRTWENLGGQISYKHNFTRSGHNLSADVNYNSSKNTNDSYYKTLYQNMNGAQKYSPVLQNSFGNGTSTFSTIQADYENPITDSKKFEGGLRTAIRNFENINDQFFDSSSNGFIFNPRLSSRYKYIDIVHAAYSTYSFKYKNLNVQLGLRAESSNYDGTMIAKIPGAQDSSFSVNYAISLFPSIFTTYKLDDKQDVQFNYSRRINRPNFFQLIPFIDYSDPQNLRMGNPGLEPEFTNSFEFSYNNNYKRGSNFLASVYYKHNTNLITMYTYRAPLHPNGADSVFFSTYTNANNSATYGLELTNRMSVVSWWDNSINFNLFNSKINSNDIVNQRTSWFVKMNNTFRLPKKFSIQFSGNYQAKTVLPQGGGGWRYGGGNIGSSQGYINPRYDFDIAIRKDFSWKGGNSASITLSVNDVFRTATYSSYTETPYFTQESERRRDPQVFRINFNYRFGKFDANLFKRKNTKASVGDSMGSDMMNF